MLYYCTDMLKFIWKDEDPCRFDIFILEYE